MERQSNTEWSPAEKSQPMDLTMMMAMVMSVKGMIFSLMDLLMVLTMKLFDCNFKMYYCHFLTINLVSKRKSVFVSRRATRARVTLITTARYYTQIPDHYI